MENKLQTAPIKLGLKLDLGSGDNPKYGFESVDVFAKSAKWQQNLLQFPWPWGDNQVQEINCSHFIEHIPMLYWYEDDTLDVVGKEGGLDLLLKFFDECYRILIPGGKMTVTWPCHRNDRAFQDPTHRRFIPPSLVFYLHKQWKESNKLSHYLGKCNFTNGSGAPPSVLPIGIHPELEMYSQEATARRFNESWNLIADWQAVLIKEVPKE